MARPQTDHEATVEQLLEAAEQLIRERGPYTVTVTDIAACCGMSQSNVYRFFPSKDALLEAMADRWFHDINEAMEATVASDLPPRDKMIAFFRSRLDIKRSRYIAEPELFRSYLILGEEHRDVVQGYIDLADHYLAMIVSEALAAGELGDGKIDELVPLINMTTATFCDPTQIVEHFDHATPENLARVIDMIFAGLRAPETAERSVAMRLAS